MKSRSYTLLACLALTGALPAQTVQPKIEYAEADLRGFWPRDGKLIEEGQISIQYVGLSLGREVRAEGKRVFVSDRTVGDRGVIFRDGYVELNIGAHVEKEVKIGFFKPTVAVDLAARAKVALDNELHVKLEIEWIYIEGDNLGGKLVVAFAKDKVREFAKRKAKALAGKLGEQLKQKLPAGLRSFQVRLEAGKVVIALGDQLK